MVDCKSRAFPRVLWGKDFLHSGTNPFQFIMTMMTIMTFKGIGGFIYEFAKLDRGGSEGIN
jgi:hypothetical protein